MIRITERIGKWINIMRKHNYTERVLAQVIKENNRTITDPAFERPEGCWDSKQEKAFLKSLFEGYMCAPITRANIHECIQHSKDIGDSNSLNYFKNKAALGASWISLDGKHRRETIRKFVENSITYTGKIITSSGEVLEYTNTYFKDMSDNAQASIMTTQMMVNEFTAVSRKELPLIFKGINSGALPTDQHLRNAEDSPMAAKSRDFHEKFKNLFANICTKRQIALMMPEEILSKMILHLESEEQITITSRTLDNFYKKGCFVGAEGEYALVYDIGSAVILKNILNHMVEIESLQDSKMITSKTSMLFFLVLEKIIRKDLSIVDYELFHSKILSLDSDLERKARKLITELEDSGKQPNLSEFYTGWARQKWAHDCRYKRQDKLWQEISQNLTSYGISEDDETNSFEESIEDENIA